MASRWRFNAQTWNRLREDQLREQRERREQQKSKPRKPIKGEDSWRKQ